MGIPYVVNEMLKIVGDNNGDECSVMTNWYYV